jgi:hypothetical protein
MISLVYISKASQAGYVLGYKHYEELRAFILMQKSLQTHLTQMVRVI